MKNKLLACVVALTLCQIAMASDIAISLESNWWGQAAANREMQVIADNVTGATVEQFAANEQAALATWVKEHTGDGIPDLLILCGKFPDSIYPSGNAQTDGSIAENFLDDGNMIINTGDWMFYVCTAGNNGAAGLQNMMDISNVTMAGGDDTPVTVTADGKDYTPSLQDFATDRPFHLDTLGGDWEVELVLAQDATGNMADPVVVHNTVTNGRIGIFLQTNGQDNDPRGAVISEWINNWFIPNLGSGGGNPLARHPGPEDGARIEQAWTTLTWTSGYYAASHDVYIGTNFDDVNDGTADTFAGNMTQTTQVLGFFGFPFPDGLQPGTTYYWRIDEVNDADPNSPWKGNVWSFWIPPTTTYDPSPLDGARFVDADVTLGWSAGLNAILNYVYFGENFDDVNNAAAGTGNVVSGTTFTPGALEPEKTYYWRVDAFTPPNDHRKGQVWSFTTGKEGGGVLGQYYQWVDPDFVSGGGNPGPKQAFTTFMLTRTDPQIDFTFSNSPDPTISDDNFSARWTGEVEAGFTETYTFYTRSDDGARLWVNGQLLIGNAWKNQGPTEYSGQIDLVAGQKYSLVMEYYENGGGAVAELRWSSPSTPKQFVPQAALSLPVRAYSPLPNNGAVDVTQTPMLQWDPGLQAVSHDIYLGTDRDAVANATKSSSEYVGSRQLGDESYSPAMLDWDTTYYWRVDEVNAVNPDSPWVGSVWSFTTAGYGIVDDFEFYNDIPEGQPGSNLVYIRYQDGFANPTVNGSTMGYITGTSMESNVVHSGNLSGPMGYNNTIASVSEVVLPFSPAQDWTANGVLTLSLWFYGDPTNMPGQLYVKINGVQVNYTGDASNLTRSVWQVWNIDLTTIGANMRNVTSFAVGIQGPGATGTLLLDDIRLYAKPREFITPIQPDPAGLVAHFALDGNANDSAGNNNGTLQGDPQWVAGYIGGALEFDGSGDWIDCGNDPSLEITGEVSVSAWIKIGAAGIDQKVCGNQDGANGGYKMGINSDKVEFEIRTSGNTAVLNRSVTGGTILQVGVWYHVVGVYSQQDGYIRTYVNGLLDRELLTNGVLGASPGNLYIGCEPYNNSVGNFNGVIDDVRIYNRALSYEEIAGLAGRTQPIDKPF